MDRDGWGLDEGMDGDGRGAERGRMGQKGTERGTEEGRDGAGPGWEGMDGDEGVYLS